MKKKLIGFIGATLLVSTIIIEVVFEAPTDNINIIVNGQEIKSSVQPLLVDDTVMVPVRDIAESLGANVTWNEEENSIAIKTKDKISKIVADIPDEGIILNAIEKDGMYEDFTLEINGTKRFFGFFGWKNISNPTYAPKLLLNDIDHDGKKELIVILTTGTGNGVKVTEAHIINPETLLEIYIDNPMAIILKNVKTKITKNEVEITIGDQKTVLDIEKINIKPENLFSNIVFNNIQFFEVINDELRVNMGAQISPTVFIGEVQISYILKDNMYQTSKIRFEKYDD